MKTITQKEEQHAAACCSETKNRYICISEESEGTSPDTLFETLPYHEPICLGVIAIGSGALVVTCALCWLGFFSKRLLDVQDGCRQQLFETELSLYRESVRREGLIQNKETVIAQLDLDIEAKRREIELAKLEKELKDLKNPK